MALVLGADVYIGGLDVLAAVAVMADRPTVLIAGPGEEDWPNEAGGVRVLWVGAEIAALVHALRGLPSIAEHQDFHRPML